MAVTGSPRPLMMVLPTGNEGSSSTGVNHGIIAQLKVTAQFELTGPLTTTSTIDGVDLAQLKTDFDTHDGGTAKAQHSAIGDHAHTGTGPEAGQLSHATAFSSYGTDNHTEYIKEDGTRAFSSTVSGVTPTSDAHLTTKAYVDAKTLGLGVITSCRARAQGNINLAAPGTTVDGVTLSVGERFLADQQSTGTQDGVYDFQGASTPATRSSDVPIGKQMRGVFTFIEEGTDADVGYVCTNDKGSDVIGTDALNFTQFSKAGNYTGGNGIDITALVVSVDLADTSPGLQFTSNKLDLLLEANKGLAKSASGLATVIEANKGLSVGASGLAGVANTAAGLELGASGFGINLQASNPSLEVVSTELAVKIYANGGLQRDTNGVSVKIDDTPDTLDVDSSGIKVVGLPSLFKVNATAVGATVTAVNLDELTDGSSSVTLHTHDLTAHLMGSVSHTADTKANVNSKISDLIATYGAFRDIGVGTAGQRPAAGSAGRFWWATDTDAFSFDNGATWDPIIAVAADHDFEGSSHLPCTLAELNAANTISDADLIASADTRLPIQGENDALVGTSGTPSTTNKYVTNDDTRNTNARTPTAHDLDAHNSCTLAELSADIEGDSIQGTSEKGTASGYMGLDAGSHGNSSPKHHDTTHENGGDDEMTLAGLDGEPSTLTTHKAVLAADATLGHVIVETASLIDVDGSGKLTLGTHSSTHQDGGTDEIATATPGADDIVKAEADGKIAPGWIDISDITGSDNTWAGKQEFNDEITVSTLLMDGPVIGPEMSATIGTGGITAGDTIKFDGSGQIIRRAANSDDANGICTVGGAASATGWYCPYGIVEVTWENLLAPTAYGEAVFLSQTGSNEMYWSTTVPTLAGKIYEAWAWGTGTAAKVFFSPRKAREIEA